MCPWRRIILVLLCTSLTAGGCQSLRNLFKKPPPKVVPIPPATQIVIAEPIRVITEQRPVKSGTLPLVYLLEHPGDLRVIDATSGVVIIGTRAGGRTILSVSQEKGVTIGGRTIRAGPLDPMHQYDIYLSTSDENVRKSVYERR